MRDLSQLPKAHLHVHLEGAMRPRTLDELCDRYDVERPPDTRGKQFDNFGGFNAVYQAASRCIRSRDDLARVIFEVADDAREQGVRWIEPAFDTERYCETRAGEPHQLFESQAQGWRFALEAAQDASRRTGVGIGFVSAIDRTLPLTSAQKRAGVTKDLVQSGEHHIEMGAFGAGAGIVALGLHGNEEGHEPERFEAIFRDMVESTHLLSTPHAGEIAPYPDGGPASVKTAVENLQAHRIMHGVLAASEPALVEQLARAQICLDVCPSSNVALSVVPSIAAHPLRALMAAGVPCDLGSDDPLLFGPSLLDEFELCRHELRFDDSELAELARNSFIYSGAPAAFKTEGVRAVDAWLDTPSG